MARSLPFGTVRRPQEFARLRPRRPHRLENGAQTADKGVFGGGVRPGGLAALTRKEGAGFRCV